MYELHNYNCFENSLRILYDSNIEQIAVDSLIRIVEVRKSFECGDFIL